MITHETRTAVPGIDWHNITGMRHRLVHQYFSIRLDVVWETVQQDIPALISQLEPLIPSDSG
ncbi:MAG: HepT-like ribonuclease domain-containing protein [Chloroflexota bacterium]|nr:DUF86 domain-containing protein [Anaerolineae bacterium]HMM28798.1 DUF86 domain-containing protein [Aggregatilineaceae bacterium]